MVEAATNFRKSGFNNADSAMLAQVAAQYQNIADTAVSASDAAASITSQIRAFGEDASFATTVINAYNEVANNFSVGTNDISNAMEIASSGMATYGNSFQQVIGLVTSGTEIMQGRASQVARGLSTIAARIVKNQDALAEYGIQVEKTDGSLKSTFDVLSELKPKWDAMTDAQRVALGDTLAGQNQYKVLASVLQNFQHAIDATNTALKSAGSAAEENARYMESLEAKENALKAEFEDFANRVLSKDVVKGFLEAGTSMLDFANNDVGAVITRIGLLTTGMTGLTGIVGQTVGKIAEVGLQLKNLGVGGGSFLGMLASGKVALIVGGVVLAVTALVEVIRALKSSYDAVHPSFEQANENLKKTQDEISQTTDKLKEYKDQLAKLDEVAVEDRGAAWQSERSELELNIEASQSYLDILERIRELQGQQAYAADRPIGYTAAGSIAKNQFQDETYYGAYQATGDRSVQLSAKQADILNAQYSDQYQALTAITLALADATDEQYRYIEAEDLAELQGKSQEEQIEIMTDMLGKLGIALNATYESSEQAFSNMGELANKTGELSQAQKEQAQSYIDSYGEIVKVGAATKEQVAAYVELAAKLNDVDIASGNAYETIALLANVLGVAPAYARDLAISMGLIDANTRPAAGAFVQLENGAWAVADGLNAAKTASDGVGEAMSNISVATYDTSTAAAQLTASLFDQNGQLTEAAQTALSVDGSMVSLAQSEIQAQQAAAQANYANLILEIQKVGSAAMITAGQLSQMMALAGVGGSTADMKRTYQQKYHKSAEADPEAYKLWLTSTLQKSGEANYKRKMEEYQKQLSQVSVYAGGGGGGGGSPRKSAEEKAAEEAEKQAKKAQKAQEKAAKESQQAYESAAKSAEQAAQEAARAAEQAAEEAKQKILDSIQELKDASDDFWDSKTDAIEETNKELDRQKQLEEKLKALEEAKQKKILLYKNGQFQYDKDYGTIAKAQADYEETRDKIQRERELEQLEEMKDNATEIFNEMKDIVQNGGDVTQSMINNWLSKMQSDGAKYYESNKAILSDWLTWAQGAIKEFSQSALESIGGGYRSTSGTYRSNAAAGGGLLESILDYQQNPKYWRNGEFIGMGAAMWTDLFEAQLASGYFGDYTTMPESIGKLPGSSVFDDWKNAFEYWARNSMQSVEALEDMIDRLVAAKGVLDRHKDEFKSLGRDDLYQKALDIQDIDEDKLFRYAKLYGAVQNPDMPFGFSPYLREDEFKNLDPDQKLAALLPMIRDYEYWTGSRTAEGEHQEWFQDRMGSKDYTLGKDYGRLTYTGDIVRTAKTYTDEGKKIYMFTDAGGDYYVDRKKTYFDQKKLAQWYEENERAISEIQEKLWEIPGDELLQKALEQELERRRQARVYSADVLGYDTEAAEAQSEYERERQSSVGYVEAKRQRKTDENLFKIQDALARLDRGNQVSDKYLSNASDYIGKVIEENAQKILDANSDAEKKALEAQNAQLELMRQQVEEGKTGQRTENVYEWEDAEFEDYDPTEDVARMLRELQQAMQENSKAWWDADEETRKQLHESNIRLAKQIEDLSNTRMTYEGHTGVWTQTARNAKGTHNFRGGLSLVGENGPELRVLKRGDNIIPTDKTENLWKWASLTPNSMLAAIGNSSAKAGNVSYGFNISNLQLPNVTDAKSLVQGLKNYALQYSYKR